MSDDGPAPRFTPRLLTEREARAYLGGVNPWNVIPPLRFSTRSRWDREALDAALDELSGLSRKADKDDDTPEARVTRFFAELERKAGP